MAGSHEDAATRFLRMFKDSIRPVLVQRLPDALFQRGSENELKRRIVEIVDERLTADQVPIGRQLRLKLIESIWADIERATNGRLGRN